MANEWETKELPRAKGQIAPAQWNPNSVAWEPYEGVRKLEQKLNDIDNRLQEIENGNTTVNTQLMGSIVEDNVIRTKTSVTLLESVEVTAGSTHFTDYIVPPKKYVVPMIRWESRTDFDVQIEFNAKGTNDYVQDRKTVYEEVNHVRQSELKKVECLSPKLRIRVSNTGDADTHIATIDAVYLD